MITALDHIAIAVPDLEGAISRFLEDFGLQHDGNEVVEAAQTTTAFFSVPETHIELVHPLDGGARSRPILRKEVVACTIFAFGPMTLTATWHGCATKGYQFIGDAPTPGAHGSRVIFIHPKSCDGVLIELSQPAEAHA
jgi:methylmalonyl-CoA/ethylmalonyl-CoA epimerase